MSDTNTVMLFNTNAYFPFQRVRMNGLFQSVTLTSANSSERIHAVGNTHLSRHSIQEPCKILLLAMFAIAARYSSLPEDHPPGQHGNHISRAGQQYAEDAHRLLGEETRGQSCVATSHELARRRPKVSDESPVDLPSAATSCNSRVWYG